MSEKIEAWRCAAGKGLLKGNIFLGSSQQELRAYPNYIPSRHQNLSNFTQCWFFMYAEFKRYKVIKAYTKIQEQTQRGNVTGKDSLQGDPKKSV